MIEWGVNNMDNTMKPLQPFIPTTRVQQLAPAIKPSVSAPAQEVRSEPAETFQLQTPSLPVETAVNTPVEVAKEKPAVPVETNLSWQQGGVSFEAQGNGPIVSYQEAPTALPSNDSQPTSFEATLKALAATQNEKTQAANAMHQREATYLFRVPFKDDEKSLKTRAAINERYKDSTTSAQSVTKTVNSYAIERGIDINKAPENLTGALSSNPEAVKKAAQGVVDRLFLSKEVSFNPEKHATVSEETSRFLDLALQAAPEGFSAADAYKLVASNLALVSYQDKAASENMLGDHGVRHLLGHNIKATEQLADGLEKQGVPVGPKDRLLMHQAMILHDLGYAMDSVRNPINSEGLKGQDAGHNVLAARYVRERSLDPNDPITKLFGASDMEIMHRSILYHDKDANGGPGVEFSMTSTPTQEQRAMNIETMTRIADNSHAFEDKLPELLYREPKSLKTLRLMKTAGELGDGALLKDLKSDLSSYISENPNLAKDDKEALLQSASSLGPESYRFSVGRIAGSKPTFDVAPDGKVILDVMESDTHQQTVGLFGLASFNQMEKFILDCTGQKTRLSGNDEVIEGGNLAVNFHSGAHRVEGSAAFNQELNSELLSDRAFTKYSYLDNSYSVEQAVLEERVKKGDLGATGELAELKTLRRELLEQYRTQA